MEVIFILRFIQKTSFFYVLENACVLSIVRLNRLYRKVLGVLISLRKLDCFRRAGSGSGLSILFRGAFWVIFYARRDLAVKMVQPEQTAFNCGALGLKCGLKHPQSDRGANFTRNEAGGR